MQRMKTNFSGGLGKCVHTHDNIPITSSPSPSINKQKNSGRKYNEDDNFFNKEFKTISKKLAPHIAGLTDIERLYHCKINSLIVRFVKRNKGKPTFIHCKHFKKTKVPGYSKYIEQQEQWGVLTIARNPVTGGKSYSSDGMKNGTGKAYPIEYFINLKAGTVVMEFNRKRPLRAKKDRATATGIDAEYEKKCFTELKVTKTIILPADCRDVEMIQTHLNSIRHGVSHLKVGEKGGRHYHPVIEMNADARINLEHRSGEPLYELDISLCHLVLLLKSCPEKEKQKYKAFLKQDVYSIIAMSVKFTRKKVKKDVCKWLNGGRVKYINDYFTKEFPALTLIITQNGKGNASKLQRLESGIIIGRMLPFCRVNSLFYNSNHDGMLPKGLREAKIIKEQIIKEVKKDTGIRPRIKINSLLEKRREIESIINEQKYLDKLKDVKKNKKVKPLNNNNTMYYYCLYYLTISLPSLCLICSTLILDGIVFIQKFFRFNDCERSYGLDPPQILLSG